ncbi:XkdX family protein [Weissella coleopterorum]|uniref:XkdX family protein n=1 Tax=Weissella coleopterorum TaxID=2714949 RepID=A0A6G8AXW9_9LACO|nr:XkdX family protein [Weissella coleopterorum]QIL49846.1 XkdX family protein [Weissella coleopterorum]
MFPTIKQYFEMGLYKEDDIKLFLDTEMITQDEYDQIIVPENETVEPNNDLVPIDKPEEDTVDE